MLDFGPSARRPGGPGARQAQGARAFEIRLAGVLG